MAGVVMALVRRATSAAQPDRTMFGHATGLTAILLIDDFLLVHDCVAAQGYDTQAKVLTLGYFVLVAAFFVRHQRTLGPTATVGIVAAVGLLGMSAALDVVANRIDQLVEDGFEFVGVCTWSTVWALRARLGNLRPMQTDQHG
jgi:hypothetical protein